MTNKWRCPVCAEPPCNVKTVSAYFTCGNGHNWSATPQIYLQKYQEFLEKEVWDLAHSVRTTAKEGEQDSALGTANNARFAKINLFVQLIMDKLQEFDP